MSSEIELLKASEWLINKDRQQCSLSLAFNYGATDLSIVLALPFAQHLTAYMFIE